MTNSVASRRPVLMIGLDAAEITLIQQWMADGLLPNLAALQRRGVLMELQSTAHWLVGAPWPAFYASSTPDRFGMYHYLVWRPEKMAGERPNPTWMPLEPFWRQLPGSDRHVIAVDVPLCYAPDAYDGIELSGWATHELLQKPGSSPPGLLGDVRREFGEAPFDEESAYELSATECIAVRDQCVETARLVGELGRSLMRKHAWDLAIVCFSSTHRGGHLLWDRKVRKGRATGAQLDSIANALRDIYVACDAAVGRLVEEAGDDAAVMVFSLHGMGPNNDRTSLLPEMLARILAGSGSGDGPVRRTRLADRLRNLVPGELRARVKQRLPQVIQDKLTLHWRSSGLDWSRTEAFVAFCDLDGYIRINLRGRERDGIVPVESYRPLCDRIADGLRTFRDADTGEPLVSEIGFAEQIFADGPMRRYLPDIVVRWNPTAAALHRRVVSDSFGSIAWPTPGRHPLGRSGNHRRRGFLIGAGGPFAGMQRPGDAHVLDLAPTVLDLLGVQQPASFQGRSLLRESR
jgi:predicted AlkP superfamily phosphohydrolase/phosphomutase